MFEGSAELPTAWRRSDAGKAAGDVGEDGRGDEREGGVSEAADAAAADCKQENAVVGGRSILTGRRLAGSGEVALSAETSSAANPACARSRCAVVWHNGGQGTWLGGKKKKRKKGGKKKTFCAASTEYDGLSAGWEVLLPCPSYS